ncbi:DUF4278 domain-containing protein [Chroococcidiopsis sp. FACHB-1243]|uniref:DUF4278 domain-containing protein n=1 Tax=Chroococcidiopsis sp. [FACHB-1243] TaxID=2692781 RepID=UPI001786ED1C|nr:DUF4278 domain-containing protein [Chroococcidiopsis sp. [FACHB-1243]]MBD2309902.1 DUF4278 domain-containing protein [Chroococcidiopsis sp. [FACHB-1243]]
MKLMYRGMTYEHHPSKADGRPFVQVSEPGAAHNLSYRGVTYRIAPQTESTQVPAKLVGQKLIYRGITYYKLIYQGSTFSVNRNV